ncbi:hypothetical protein Pvag_pPag20194 (plasmid) [Pantoea vagans C9-1]|nr:hypothetical protein Pvag_pPag20194 [Pantoea vagans C9-1]
MGLYRVEKIGVSWPFILPASYPGVVISALHVERNNPAASAQF